jgi:hypothetical protein
MGMIVFYVMVIVRLAQQASWQGRLAPLAACRCPTTSCRRP